MEKNIGYCVLNTAIELIEEGEKPYLKYMEDLSKKHPGGLKGRKMKLKIVFHHSNSDLKNVLLDFKNIR